MIQQEAGSLDLHVIVQGIVFTAPGEVILVSRGILRLARHGNIAFRFGISDLYFIGEQVLGEEPGSQDLLGDPSY